MTKRPDGNGGFYADQYNAEERERIADASTEPSLQDEIWMQRVVNHRLLARMNNINLDELSLEALVELARTVEAGNARLAQLLRDQQALDVSSWHNPLEDDPLAHFIIKAVADLAREFEFEITLAEFARFGIPFPFDLQAFVEMQAHDSEQERLNPRCKTCPDWEDETRAQTWFDARLAMGPGAGVNGSGNGSTDGDGS